MAYGYDGGGRGAGRGHPYDDYDFALNGYDRYSFTRQDPRYDNFISRQNPHEPRFSNYSGGF
jgi:hypothetical protein